MVDDDEAQEKPSRALWSDLKFSTHMVAGTDHRDSTWYAT
jgi:hypothetical protein